MTSSSVCNKRYEHSDEELIKFHSCEEDIESRLRDARQDQKDAKHYHKSYVRVDGKVTTAISMLWDLETYKGRGINTGPPKMPDKSRAVLEEGSLAWLADMMGVGPDHSIMGNALHTYGTEEVKEVDIPSLLAAINQAGQTTAFKTLFNLLLTSANQMMNNARAG
jgi:hypothetical protein